jgi:mono/diheme cytochrome c family protein
MRRFGTTTVGLVALGALVGALATTATGQAKGNATAGKALYGSEDCGACHGAAGKGDGAQGQKLKDKPTDWTTGDGGGMKGLTDEQLFDVIAKGGRAIGKSRGMPASKLTDQQVWDLVAYVKTLTPKK